MMQRAKTCRRGPAIGASETPPQAEGALRRSHYAPPSPAPVSPSGAGLPLESARLKQLGFEQRRFTVITRTEPPGASEARHGSVNVPPSSSSADLQTRQVVSMNPTLGWTLRPGHVPSSRLAHPKVPRGPKVSWGPRSQPCWVTVKSRPSCWDPAAVGSFLFGGWGSIGSAFTVQFGGTGSCLLGWERPIGIHARPRLTHPRALGGALAFVAASRAREGCVSWCGDPRVG